MSKNIKGIALSLIAASTFSLSSYAMSYQQHQEMNQGKNLKPNQMVRCMGMTSCKGLKHCTDPCKGVRACKEKGYVLTTKNHCDKMRATNNMMHHEQQQSMKQQPMKKHSMQNQHQY